MMRYSVQSKDRILDRILNMEYKWIFSFCEKHR